MQTGDAVLFPEFVPRALVVRGREQPAIVWGRGGAWPRSDAPGSWRGHCAAV